MIQTKTNVMRILEQHKIAYSAYEYPHGKEAVDGETVAALLGQDPAQVFKTLVARGKSGSVYVFVIPVAGVLSLKQAAAAVGEKAVSMIAVKELLGLTGYVRGGCSPVGLKKPYRVTLHESAKDLQTVIVSAGKIGLQVELSPTELLQLVGGQTADLLE